MIIKTAIIQKLKGGKYRLYSRKKDPKTHKRHNLGTYDSLAAAKKREQQVQYFKHQADDGKSDDKKTKMLSDLSDIAVYLEKAGFIDKADKVYAVMNLVDGSLEQYLVDPYPIPDDQRNVENQGYIGGDGTGGGYSGLHAPAVGQPADDGNYNPYKELYELNVKENERLMHLVAKLQKENNQLYTILDAIKGMHLAPVDKYFERFVTKKPEEQDNADAFARSNGLIGNSVLEGAGFSGLSDAYFYRGVGSIEDNM